MGCGGSGCECARTGAHHDDVIAAGVLSIEDAHLVLSLSMGLTSSGGWNNSLSVARRQALTEMVFH
ncbi:hypothetical protein GCM10009712_42440 [Pseudarthrobacter sulfonivorans]